MPSVPTVGGQSLDGQVHSGQPFHAPTTSPESKRCLQRLIWLLRGQLDGPTDLCHLQRWSELSLLHHSVWRGGQYSGYLKITTHLDSCTRDLCAHSDSFRKERSSCAPTIRKGLMDHMGCVRIWFPPSIMFEGFCVTFQCPSFHAPVNTNGECVYVWMCGVPPLCWTV